MSDVHPTAIVHSDATIAPDVTIGPYVVIGPGVAIGPGTVISPHAVIERDTRIGARCRIGVGAALGGDPQHLKYAGEPTRLEIGDDSTIREYVTVHRGTAATGRTSIGNRCYLMAYVHVGHDVVVHDDVVLANGVQLGGHVQVGRHASIGGGTPVHQFVRIGDFAFVGGGSRVPQDVPPFARAAGNPLRLYGINSVGLERAGFSPDVRRALQRAFRLLFNSELRRTEAIERLREDGPRIAEVDELIEFIATSERGIPQC
ncbi:MAG TPA: acyl-ACP--UDP-N-acetylglucosamine O-acyltransferase [Gemmatimonadales bacterium]|nr:acyl-ACP--UDP-N-acetylglucosamine O-acyltransferase [Gemmatimonadales bacterium]